jgi:hypothetical protein
MEQNKEMEQENGMHNLAEEDLTRAVLASFEHQEPGQAPDGKKMDVPFYTMSYDFLLAPV